MYRIEHKITGIGHFYNTMFIMANYYECVPYSRRHGDFPTPKEEGLSTIKDGLEWFCSYNSIELLKKFMLKQELEFLTDNEYRVFQIQATDVQVGEFQTLFTKESILSKVDVTEKILNSY